LININTATQKELEALPGIGPGKAGDIIEYRQNHGDFDTIEDIQNVSGIGESLFQEIKDQITTTP
jgi:competence protein ComEA